MSRTTEDFRDDARKAPDELEREIDAARNRIDHTLDLLERRLSPTELIDQVVGIARRNGGTFARNLASQVQNKPIPTLVAGVGLLWLMSASDRPPQHDQDERSGIGEGLRGMAQGARQRAHEMGERVREMGRATSDAASRAGDRMHEMHDSIGDGADKARRAGAHGARRARDEYQHLMREHPLLLGGLGLALGAALGAMVPRTATEDRVMGEASDHAREKVRETGKHQYELARDAAQRVTGAAREQAEQSGTERHDGEGRV